MISAGPSGRPDQHDRTTRGLRRAASTTGPAAGPRADLIHGLALLSARALPGSPLARGLARVNRGLDHWPWSPRRLPGLRPARLPPS